MRSAFVSPWTFDGFIPGTRTGKEGIRPGIDHGLDDDGLALPTLVEPGGSAFLKVRFRQDDRMDRMTDFPGSGPIL